MTLKATFDSVALKANMATLKNIGEIEFTQKLGNEIGSAIVEQVKDQLSKGISPVKEEGRFAGYKKSYVDAIQKGRYPGKSVRPVNLKLSGDLINSLDYTARGLKNAIEVKINFYGQEDKEDWLRSNPTHAASRKALPRGSEGFNVSIQKTIKDLVNEFIINLLKKR